MALRHEIPNGFTLDIDRSVEPSRPPAVMREPAKVGFRTGADLKGVVAAVRASKVVAVDAAVGSGKTVRLPSALADALGLLVVHVFPSELLALDQSEYVASVSSVPIVYVTQVDQDLPVEGVAFMSAAMAVARLLASRRLASSDVLLFLDECHESDAYMYVMRSLASGILGVRHVVLASATYGVGAFRGRETYGTIQCREFEDPETVDMWDPLEEGKPWSISNFIGNALLFVDSKTHAERLVVEFDKLGLYAYRLYARMPKHLFQNAMRALRDKDGPLVVLIADYSFRSGYTFDVSLVVDSGIVPYMVVEGSAPVRKWRQAYALEKYQASGRAGRTEGSSAVYYAPKVTERNAICDLDGVELDAAVVLLRCLGYAAPRVLQHSVFAQGDVPRNMLHALRDAQPFSCLTSGFLEPFVQAESRRDSGYGALKEEACAETVRDIDVGGAYRFQVPAMATVANPVGHCHGMASVTTSDFWEDQFEKLTLMAQSEFVERVESGKFYYAEGLSDQPRKSRAFPKGLDSLRSLLAQDNFTFRLKCMRSDDRLCALACALDRYNGITAELAALSQLLEGNPMDGLGHGVRSDVRVRWARHIAELVSSHISEAAVLAAALPSMCEDLSALKLMEQGLPAVVDQFKAYHVEHMGYFGAGHARDVSREYAGVMQVAERQLVGDTPLRSGYALQRGIQGVPAEHIRRQMNPRLSNVDKSLPLGFLSWVKGVRLVDDGGGTLRQVNPKRLKST